MSQALSLFPELHALETRILTRLSDNVPLRDLLEDITLTVDRLMADVRSSILLVENGHIRHGAAPNLPAAYNAVIDGLAIGPKVGSCGTAAWRRRQVIVLDAQVDPLWEDFREVAIEHNIRACWSTPVLDAEHQPLATFAIYNPTAREPNRAEINFINRISHFVRVAVERARQREQIRQTEEKLLQMERLEALVKLTGSVANDFNALLSNIIKHTNILASTLNPPAPQQQSLQQISDAASYGLELTTRLLSFARQQALEPVNANIAQTLTDLLPGIQGAMGEQICVEYILDHALWPVNLDVEQFKQAVLNICTNSRDAMSGAGALVVKADNVSVDNAPELLSSDLSAGDYVVLSISDNGTGMDEETRLRAFEPFFTRKTHNHNGLGLSMVYGFTRQSGGLATIASNDGGGTTIKLYFPRAYYS